MRLVKVTIRAFQCIEQAEIVFGPGLNVLYGPNDLGKSSLASAVRAVLLLPHGSSAYESLLSWHSGVSPCVTLTFSTDQQRFWRVRKCFGSGRSGSSALEFSKDGNSFSVDSTGRQVDEKLRELLRWGIRKPGGLGGSRGFPDSFLVNVLLAEQADVPSILGRDIAQDPDESGREFLNEALQALAQDPLFKRVLDEAQGHVIRAFTSTGKKSRRQGSPFQKGAEEIRALGRQQDLLQAKLNATVSAEQHLRTLGAELDTLIEDLAGAKDKLAQVQESHRRWLARANVEAELGAARPVVEEIRKELAEVQKLSKHIETLEVELKHGEVALSESVDREKQASVARDETKDRFRAATSEKEAQARELKRHQLENERHKKRDERAGIQADVKAAEQAQQLGKDAREAREKLNSLQEELAHAEENVTSLAEVSKAAMAQVDQLRHVEAYGRLVDARRILAEAETAEASAKADRAAAAEQRAEAEAFEKQAAGLEIPDHQVVETLRSLRQQLEVAEARLGGGLTVHVRRQEDIALKASVDGELPNESQGRDPFDLEGQRSIDLHVENLLDITITAGAAAARKQTEDLRRQWSEEGEPSLERAGVADVAALEEAWRRKDDLVRRAAARRAEAQRLEQRAKELHERVQGIDLKKLHVTEREQALLGQDENQLASLFEDFGESWEVELEQQRSSAERERKDCAAELENGSSRCTELRTRLLEREENYQRSKTQADAATGAFSDEVHNVLESGRGQLGEIDRVISGLAAQIDSLSKVAESQQDDARQALHAAESKLKDAANNRESVEAMRRQKAEQLAKATGTLEGLQKQIEKLDLAAAEKKVVDIEGRLAQMPMPESPATEADVDETQNVVEFATRAVEEKQREIHMAQGGLEQVGGGVIREQKEEIDRALEVAVEREHEVEVEYEAWQLLAETLRDVENSDGAHLGEALSGLLTQRFKELTTGRYGKLAIGPNLETEGLDAAGKIRHFDALSVGTKDQLATLFRLCIAEQIQSTVILDDHLSQSDPNKIEWFRALLRRTGQSIQVILLTCRSGDYLLDEEIPDKDEIVRDRAGGLLRAVDLARAIRRYP